MAASFFLPSRLLCADRIHNSPIEMRTLLLYNNRTFEITYEKGEE